MVPSQDLVTAIALLKGLHDYIISQQLKMDMDEEVGEKPMWKLSFCPFCQYYGNNDSSYPKHIVCMHYCANFGCGKCLDMVFPSGQKLSKHMKWCKGHTKDEAEEKSPSCHMKEVPKASSNSKKKKKHKSQEPKTDL